MESNKTLMVRPWRKIFHCFALLLFCGAAFFFAHQTFASGAVLGRVLDLEGVVGFWTPGEGRGLLSPGMTLRTGTELDLKPESWVVVTMADSTVRKFTGPANITMSQSLEQERGSVLTRLGSALVDMLFAAEQEGSEVVMVTRKKEEGDPGETAAKHVLTLARPAPGASLLEEPTEFEWVQVDGIPLYRVSVYSWDRLMWQGTTSNSSIECPPEECQFEAGADYYWVVEGLIGNSALRSEPAKFKLLPQDIRSELSRTLSDENLPVLSKVGICLSLNLYHKALELADFYLTQRPSADAKGYRLRAEIKGMMGLYQDAFFDYVTASQLSPGN